MRSPLRTALLVVACAASATAGWAQVPADSARRQAVRALLRAQRVDSQMVAGMDVAFATQQADPNLPSGFMDSLRLRARRTIGTFVEGLVPVYDSLFTPADIAQLTAFYASPVGQRLVAAQPALSAALAELSERWGMALAAEVLLDFSRHPARRP